MLRTRFRALSVVLLATVLTSACATSGRSPFFWRANTKTWRPAAPHVWSEYFDLARGQRARWTTGPSDHATAVVILLE